MHLPTVRPRRPIAPDPDRRLTAQVPAHPRDAAVLYIRGQVEDGLAGLDSYDETVLVVDAHPFERVWAHRALELVAGDQMVVDERMWAGRIRFRAIIDGDLRRELGLDAADAPVMVEPLASRAASSAPTAVMDAIFGVLPETPAFIKCRFYDNRVLSAVEDEPVSAPAMRAAKDAYDRHGIAEKQAH